MRGSLGASAGSRHGSGSTVCCWLHGRDVAYRQGLCRVYVAPTRAHKRHCLFPIAWARPCWLPVGKSADLLTGDSRCQGCGTRPGIRRDRNAAMGKRRDSKMTSRQWYGWWRTTTAGPVTRRGTSSCFHITRKSPCPTPDGARAGRAAAGETGRGAACSAEARKGWGHRRAPNAFRAACSTGRWAAHSESGGATAQRRMK
ncbi:MAG: hypothetical protein J3K34DRAFT_217832 [Monoraphidium minutum]|nr:MAG: hypothetical protein J3K34DRAFT_217832 [Monoraphidium minutum]